MNRKIHRVFFCMVGFLLLISVLSITLVFHTDKPSVARAAPGGSIRVPIISQPVSPVVWNGDVRDLPQLDSVPPSTTDLPRPGSVNTPAEAPSTWVDPLVKDPLGSGSMPDPLSNFEGLYITDGGGWRPPDTNRDVGP